MLVRKVQTVTFVALGITRFEALLAIPMTTSSPSRRTLCVRCHRPQSTCICPWIAPVVQAVEVLVLQHPLEVNQAKGSARLLHLSLPNSRLVTGEVFAPQELQALLTAPFQPEAAANRPKYPVLLYPQTPQDLSMGLLAPPALAPALLRDPAQLRLVVLDGTWRKSRKMLYRNPLLQQLPRLSLCDVPASNYQIRKAHRPDQLSTLEATCTALAQLGCDGARLQPLWAAFNGFVAQQQGYRPSSDPDQ